jgi:hypothetical protein
MCKQRHELQALSLGYGSLSAGASQLFSPYIKYFCCKVFQMPWQLGRYLSPYKIWVMSGLQAC